MMKSIDNFDLLKEVAVIKSKLPALPKRPRKNLFDILKIQHREIRNSNILAYFFNPNEEHGFGSLFYDSLLEILTEKIAALQNSHPHIKFADISSFDEIHNVNTEEQTNRARKEKAKSIDIVLEGTDWIIGIENKLHHNLINPLDIYWEHLQTKKEFALGLVLSLKSYKPDECKANGQSYFLNITHLEFLERVQQNIQLTGDSSDTDIFYLREYFKNIESHYYHLKPTPEMDAIVQEVTENYETINSILKKKEAAENHIEGQINTVFSSFGYVKASKWFRREDRMFDLYFYLPPASELMRTNSLWLCFEIRNQTNQTVDKGAFTNHFRNEFTNLKNFKQNAIVSNKQRTHAFIYQEDNFFQKGISFKEKFEEVLKILIEVGDAPVKKVEKYLEERNHFKND